jgi:hypothetical protein
MRYTNIAIPNATAKPNRAAKWMRICRMPIAPNSTTTGKAANAVERNGLPSGS